MTRRRGPVTGRAEVVLLGNDADELGTGAGRDHTGRWAVFVTLAQHTGHGHDHRLLYAIALEDVRGVVAGILEAEVEARELNRRDLA